MNSISNIKIALGLSNPPLQTIKLSGGLTKSSIDVLRTDLIHPIISGNKFYKLSHYLLEYQQKDYQGMVSFGGAYSNHLLATAAVCHQLNIPFTAVIRGEEPPILGPTLLQLMSFNTQLHFIKRTEYPANNIDLEVWKSKFPHQYIIQSGGEGILGIKGAAHIADEINFSAYDHIFLPVGTGTTMAGLMHKLVSHQTIHGILALKIADQENNTIRQMINKIHPGKNNFKLHHSYHFGGFGKSTIELLNYMNDLFDRTNIPTDQVYTAKMFYAVEDLLQQSIILPHQKILIIHSGGLQGNRSVDNKILKFQ